GTRRDHCDAGLLRPLGDECAQRPGRRMQDHEWPAKLRDHLQRLLTRDAGGTWRRSPGAAVHRPREVNRKQVCTGVGGFRPGLGAEARGQWARAIARTTLMAHLPVAGRARAGRVLLLLASVAALIAAVVLRAGDRAAAVEA